MNSDEQKISQLILSIDLGEDTDDEELDLTSRRLRAELLEMDLGAVDFVEAGELPQGAKSAEAITLGSLSVAVLPTLLPRLVDFLQSWSLRSENRKVLVKTQIGDRSIELEYSPSALSPEELDRLVNTLAGALKSPPEADAAST